MQIRDYLRILRKSWIIIFVCGICGFGAAAVWSFNTTATYKAETSLYVSVRMGESAGTGDMVQGTTFARQAVVSYVDVVTSAIVMDQVVEKLDLPYSGAVLAEKITAVSPQDTVLINISVVDKSPRLAAQIANTTGEVFTEVVTNQLEKPVDDGPTRVQIDTIEPATAPFDPISPKTVRNMLLGALIGVAVGVTIAVLREALDTRLRSKEDISSLTEVPVVGGVIFDPKSKDKPLIVKEDPRSPRAEAIRALRTNLQFLEFGSERHSFTITSANPSEGKTTTIANLALALAEANEKVILIDADLRKPEISRYMGIEGSVGLTDVLLGNSPVDEVMQKWGKKELYVLPSGHRPPNPSELLGSPQMRDMIDQLGDDFDYVLVDTPPILAVTDAAVVSRFTEGMLLAVSVNSTKRVELAGALEALENSGTNVSGIVLTMLPIKGPDVYRYGTYRYGGKTGYSEGAHSAKSEK